MTVAAAIRSSRWWQAAAAMHDRHHPEERPVSVADHLEAVLAHLVRLLAPDPAPGLRRDLAAALTTMGLDTKDVLSVLTPVALLHDIGKPAEDKEPSMDHPVTGKAVPRRHPVLGVAAGLELLPPECTRRDTILALVEEHDTPYSWYRQFRATGQLPSRKGWGRLDEKIAGRLDGSGIVLLAVFTMADIDGHEDITDVLWFVEQANNTYLAALGRPLPVPTDADLRALMAGG
jgi:hypothetical protein